MKLPPLSKDKVAALKRMDKKELLTLMSDTTVYIRAAFPAQTEEELHRNAIVGAHKARCFVGEPIFTTDEVRTSKQWLLDHFYEVPEQDK